MEHPSELNWDPGILEVSPTPQAPDFVARLGRRTTTHRDDYYFFMCQISYERLSSAEHCTVMTCSGLFENKAFPFCTGVMAMTCVAHLHLSARTSKLSPAVSVQKL